MRDLGFVHLLATAVEDAHIDWNFFDGIEQFDDIGPYRLFSVYRDPELEFPLQFILLGIVIHDSTPDRFVIFIPLEGGGSPGREKTMESHIVAKKLPVIFINDDSI